MENVECGRAQAFVIGCRLCKCNGYIQRDKDDFGFALWVIKT
jgi:hypothetical protein